MYNMDLEQIFYEERNRVNSLLDFLFYSKKINDHLNSETLGYNILLWIEIFFF